MNPLKHMAVAWVESMSKRAKVTRVATSNGRMQIFATSADGRANGPLSRARATERPQLHWIIPTCHRRIHSLHAGPLGHSESTVIATAAGFRVGRHLDSALPASLVPRLCLLRYCGTDGRTGRKVNRPQRQVEVKLKSAAAAAGDATGDDKPGRVLDKQAEREYERELNLVRRCTFTLAIETTARERRSRVACMTHQDLQSEKR